MIINFIKNIYPYGVHLGEDVEVPDNAPFYLFDIPIGDSRWYTNPPKHRLAFASKRISAVETNFCPMRGSKAGISAVHSAGLKQRKYEYEYFFSRYAAKFFARKMKAANTRVLSLACKSAPLFASKGNSPQERCAHDEFVNEFIISIGADFGESTDWELRNGVRVEFVEELERLVVVNVIGAREKTAPIIGLLRELAA